MIKNITPLSEATAACIDAMLKHNCTVRDSVSVAFAVVGTSAVMSGTDPNRAFEALASLCNAAILESQKQKQEKN